MTSLTTSQKVDAITVWPVQHAKARFSELLDACQREGPQVVSRRGTEAAVLVPIEQWHRLQAAARPSLKQLLLASDALGARNVGDFSHFEVPLLNPFTSRADLSR